MPVKFAPRKLVWRRVAPSNNAPLRSALVKSAQRRLVSRKSAPCKFVSLNTALFKFAPRNSASLKSKPLSGASASLQFSHLFFLSNRSTCFGSAAFAHVIQAIEGNKTPKTSHDRFIPFLTQRCSNNQSVLVRDSMNATNAARFLVWHWIGGSLNGWLVASGAIAQANDRCLKVRSRWYCTESSLTEKRQSSRPTN